MCRFLLGSGHWLPTPVGDQRGGLPSFSPVKLGVWGSGSLGSGFLFDIKEAWFGVVACTQSEVGKGPGSLPATLLETHFPGPALPPAPSSPHPSPASLLSPSSSLPIFSGSLYLSPTNLYSVSVFQKEKLSRRTNCLKAMHLF